MARPDFEDSIAGDDEGYMASDGPQSSTDFLQFGAQGGMTMGLHQESATGTVFGADSDSSDD